MATYTGTAGADVITGSQEADVIDGAGGADTLMGSAGDDLIFLRDGVVLVDGGAGVDTLSLANGLAEATRVDLNLVGLQQVWASRGEAVELAGIENVLGHADVSNVLIGDHEANLLVGGGQSDTLLGGSGDDRLDGGPGADLAVFGADLGHFAISALGGRWMVSDVSSGLGLGSDTVTNVEAFQFADRGLDLAVRDNGIDTAARNLLRDPGAWSVLVGNGVETSARATSEIVAAAAATSSVAILSYEFFTGRMPGAGGMDYLVSPTGPNANNLNSAYYQTFNLENRYINFAVNLGKAGEGRAAFVAAYGAKDLFEATRSAYATIFGEAPSDAKLHALLDPTVDLGGQVMTRSQYFDYYGQDGVGGIGTKAAMVGWLLAEAVKADVGVYARSNDAFLSDLVDGADFGVDLIGVYGRPEFVFHPG